MRYRIFLGCFSWYRTFFRSMLLNKWRQDAIYTFFASSQPQKWYRTWYRMVSHLVSYFFANKWRQDAKNWLWYRSIAGIAFFYTYIRKKNTHRENYKKFPYRRPKIVRYLRYYDTFTKRCSYINTFLGIVLVS